MATFRSIKELTRALQQGSKLLSNMFLQRKTVAVKVRIVWDAEQEKYYFSIAGIVQVLTDSDDDKQYIKRMRARDAELNSKWGTILPPPVVMLAPDGSK